MSTAMMNILPTLTTLIPTKTVISATRICSVMMPITAIKIITTSTTTVKTTATSTTLIQRKILTTSSYIIIANAIKVISPYKMW